MKNRSVPADIVLPHISYQNLSEASDWLTRTFGFSERFRYGDPLSGIQMVLGEAFVMLHRLPEGGLTPAQLGYGTQMLTVFVPDVDAHYKHSIDAGAMIVEELQETIYGERQYGVVDLDGHKWLFSQHARNVDPAEWGATIAKKIEE